MRNRRNSGNLFSQLGMMGIGSVVFIAILFVAGIFAWMYLFSAGSEISTKALLVEGIVYGLIFVLSMIGIFVTGYEDDTMKYIGHCYRGGILLTVIGFYITKLPVLTAPDKLQGQYIYYGLQFIIYVLLAVVLAMVPILVIAGIRHIILDIFDLITR